jgi:hypothetical protein
MNDIFTTPKDFGDWLTTQSNLRGKLKEPITFKFKTHDDFAKASRLLGNATGIESHYVENTIKHEFAHADMCQQLGVYYHFRIDLEPPLPGRQMKIIPMVTHRIPKSVSDFEYARMSLLIALAPEDPSEDDLRLAEEFKRIIEANQP